MNTVSLLEAELTRTREQSPPSVIDLSELRFLDLAGLRVLLRVVEREIAGTTRLVGATGIVRRLIDLAHALDHEGQESVRAPFPVEPSTRIAAEFADAVPAPAGHSVMVNGTQLGAAAATASSSSNGNGTPR